MSRITHPLPSVPSHNNNNDTDLLLSSDIDISTIQSDVHTVQNVTVKGVYTDMCTRECIKSKDKDEKSKKSKSDEYSDDPLNSDDSNDKYSLNDKYSDKKNENCCTSHTPNKCKVLLCHEAVVFLYDDWAEMLIQPGVTGRIVECRCCSISDQNENENGNNENIHYINNNGIHALHKLNNLESGAKNTVHKQEIITNNININNSNTIFEYIAELSLPVYTISIKSPLFLILQSLHSVTSILTSITCPILPCLDGIVMRREIVTKELVYGKIHHHLLQYGRLNTRQNNHNNLNKYNYSDNQNNYNNLNINNTDNNNTDNLNKNPFYTPNLNHSNYNSNNPNNINSNDNPNDLITVNTLNRVISFFIPDLISLSIPLSDVMAHFIPFLSKINSFRRNHRGLAEVPVTNQVLGLKGVIDYVCPFNDDTFNNNLNNMSNNTLNTNINYNNLNINFNNNLNNLIWSNSLGLIEIKTGNQNSSHLAQLLLYSLITGCTKLYLYYTKTNTTYQMTVKHTSVSALMSTVQSGKCAYYLFDRIINCDLDLGGVRGLSYHNDKEGVKAYKDINMSENKDERVKGLNYKDNKNIIESGVKGLTHNNSINNSITDDISLSDEYEHVPPSQVVNNNTSNNFNNLELNPTLLGLKQFLTHCKCKSNSNNSNNSNPFNSNNSNSNNNSHNSNPNNSNNSICKTLNSILVENNLLGTFFRSQLTQILKELKGERQSVNVIVLRCDRNNFKDLNNKSENLKDLNNKNNNKNENYLNDNLKDTVNNKNENLKDLKDLNINNKSNNINNKSNNLTYTAYITHSDNLKNNKSKKLFNNFCKSLRSGEFVMCGEVRAEVLEYIYYNNESDNSIEMMDIVMDIDVKRKKTNKNIDIYANNGKSKSSGAKNTVHKQEYYHDNYDNNITDNINNNITDNMSNNSVLKVKTVNPLTPGTVFPLSYTINSSLSKHMLMCLIGVVQNNRIRDILSIRLKEINYSDNNYNDMRYKGLEGYQNNNNNKNENMHKYDNNIKHNYAKSKNYINNNYNINYNNITNDNDNDNNIINNKVLTLIPPHLLLQFNNLDKSQKRALTLALSVCFDYNINNFDILHKQDDNYAHKQHDNINNNNYLKDILNIHGKPGTGKTTILRLLILILLHNKKRVLLVCYTNRAIDNVLKGLDQNDNVYRAVHTLREYYHNENNLKNENNKNDKNNLKNENNKNDNIDKMHKYKSNYAHKQHDNQNNQNNQNININNNIMHNHAKDKNNISNKNININISNNISNNLKYSKYKEKYNSPLVCSTVAGLKDVYFNSINIKSISNNLLFDVLVCDEVSQQHCIQTLYACTFARKCIGLGDTLQIQPLLRHSNNDYNNRDKGLEGYSYNRDKGLEGYETNINNNLKNERLQGYSNNNNHNYNTNEKGLRGYSNNTNINYLSTNMDLFPSTCDLSITYRLPLTITKILKKMFYKELECGNKRNGCIEVIDISKYDYNNDKNMNENDKMHKQDNNYANNINYNNINDLYLTNIVKHINKIIRANNNKNNIMHDYANNKNNISNNKNNIMHDYANNINNHLTILCYYNSVCDKLKPIFINQTVTTVDKYQGNECSICIVVAYKEDSDKNNILHKQDSIYAKNINNKNINMSNYSLLASRQRLCVALSRATHSVYILGNVSVLKDIEVFDELFKEIDKL